MADFCSLCGYNDLDIKTIYNKLIKNDVLEDIKILKTDDEFILVNVGGICEHCGIISFGVNRKFEVWGVYYGGENNQFGIIDKETSELIIFEDNPKYNEQKINAECEIIFMELENKLLDAYCFINKIIKSEITSEDIEKVNNLYNELVNKIIKNDRKAN